MKCYFLHYSNRGNEIWGDEKQYYWVVDIEHTAVSFCRKVLKNKYRNKWINIIYFDDKYLKYTNSFFSEICISLYPKYSKIPRDAYKWKVIHGDIERAIRNNVTPITLIIRGVRVQDNKILNKYTEKIIGVTRISPITTRGFTRL